MKEPSLLMQKPDYIVCTCMCVMYSDIIQALDNGATTFDDIQELLYVGTGCSSCIQEVHEIIKKHTVSSHRS